MPRMNAPESESRLTELDIATATGVWVVRSSSPTVYFIDADDRMVFRARAEGSGAGPGDNKWCRLISLNRLPDGAVDTITVGSRHRYLLDPDPRGDQHQWWIQRVVLAIERVSDEAVPA